jgi:DNA-binding XRE family transcriptional regulator
MSKALSDVLKNEISRLTKKELKSVTEPIRKALAISKAEVAGLKKRVAELEKTLSRVEKSIPKKAKSTTAPEKLRITSERFAAFRNRLGFSAAEMGLLLGVSGQTVFNLEKRDAPFTLAQRVLISKVWGLSKRALMHQLNELKIAEPTQETQEAMPQTEPVASQALDNSH